MGTRADFYVGKGSDAEWIGSIAWDGYPEGIAPRIFTAKTEKTYRKRVEAFFENDRNDVTRPKDGWPWPWEDSCTTDYAYTFHKGKVYVSSFGARYILQACQRQRDPVGEMDGERPQGDLPQHEGTAEGYLGEALPVDGHRFHGTD